MGVIFIKTLMIKYPVTNSKIRQYFEPILSFLVKMILSSIDPDGEYL
jgi:hypothetical protein